MQTWRSGRAVHSIGTEAVDKETMVENFGGEWATARVEGVFLGQAARKYLVKWTNLKNPCEREYGANHAIFKSPIPVRSVAWSPKGDQIVSGDGDDGGKQRRAGILVIRSTTTGEKVSEFKGHKFGVNCVAWSPEGGKIVSAAGNHHSKAPGELFIWDLSKGKKALELKRERNAAVISVAWSPTGDKLASGSSDKYITIWNAMTGDLISELEGHSFFICCVAWSPDGQRVVTGGLGPGGYGTSGDLFVWNIESGERLNLSHHTDAVLTVAWSPKGNRIASGSVDETIVIWDAISGVTLKILKHGSQIDRVLWSPKYDDQLVSASSGKLSVWDPDSGTRVSKMYYGLYIRALDFSPEGDKIVAGSIDGIIFVLQASCALPLAVAMAHHSRLGRQSRLALLDIEVLRKIAALMPSEFRNSFGDDEVGGEQRTGKPDWNALPKGSPSAIRGLKYQLL